jgi:hypothetical protein
MFTYCMNSKEYYINMAITISNLMQPNKLYNSRMILKLLRSNKIIIDYGNLSTTLKYLRSNSITHYDNYITDRLIYWRK